MAYGAIPGLSMITLSSLRVVHDNRKSRSSVDILEHLIDPYGLLFAAKSKLVPAGVVIASIPSIRYYRAFVKLVVHD